jgi:hypothetical protein
MRITVKTGIIAAFAWILIKMFTFYTGITGTSVVPLVMLNILGVLLAVSIGLFLHKRKAEEESNLLSDIKNGMSAGVPYAVIVSLFLYVYYTKIDATYNEHRIAEFETGLLKEIDDPIKLKELKTSNPEFEVKTRDEIYDAIMQGPKSFFKASSTMTISLLALLLLATLNSIFVSVVYRRLIFKQ